MQIEILIRSFLDGAYDERLLDIYADETKISYQRERYINAIKKFEQCYKPGDVELFSAPGRSEIGGNHTDHQNGEVLAASVNLDTIGIVKKTDDNVIRLVSDNYDEIIIRLDDVSVKEKEKETTKALIKGVVSGFLERKYAVGGFQAYITSDVLIGAGLSSSAAFETLIGTILSGLYNCGKVSATEIAIIGQYAENVYFGKPCGLMDQMASSTGNLVHIDFANPENPQVEKIDFDMEKYGYRLCITDTKGSHADLTDEYAAVPKEMKLVAKYFGKKVLRDVSANDVLENIHNLREKLGDRCVLRALHFICENERVRKEVRALKSGNIGAFLENVKASGNSSFKYLQNVYSNQDIKNQNVSVALLVSDMLLGENGVCRVHGGGFAGTIQAFVKNEYVESSKFFLYSSGSNAFLGFSSSGKWAGLGLNTLSSTLGGTSALMRLEYTTNHNDINYGAVINVNGGYRNYALFCNGGLRLNGAISTARYVRPGAKTNAIINDIGYMDTYLFQPTSYINVYLPSRNTVSSKMGTVYNDYGDSWSEIGYNSVIFIHVIVSRHATDAICVRPEDTNTPLVNENGDSITLDMRKGDCATFAYINQTWYLFNKNF